jgi:basic membrane protein A
MNITNKYFITFFTTVVMIAIIFAAAHVFFNDYSKKRIKAGFIYIGDQGTAYTNNFFRAQTELEDALGENVQTVAKFNITESACGAALKDLISQGCNIIFATSYGYGDETKAAAALHPEIQFCHATGTNAHCEPYLPNYHNFMGTIYEGRYVSGVVAGMKLSELIAENKLSQNAAKVGYVAAFPYPEVISGYTAFFLGVRSVVGGAVMSVKYTNTWSNHIAEKKYAEALIDEGCVIISQHSDTTGPAIACEEASSMRGKTVFHVGYNQSMADVAPTTSLVSSRINWTPYVIAATRAVLEGKKIENVIKTPLSEKANDAAAGFSSGWVEIIGINSLITADGTKEEIERIIKQLKTGSINVFSGNYIGINPLDKNDTWDLRTPFQENAEKSAPSFCYVLKDIITVQ